MSIDRLLFLLFLFSVCWQKAWSIPQDTRCDSTEVLLSLDSLTIQELVVSGKKAPIVMQGDTLVFDVSCFFVPEGAKLRLLLERIPGIEITADGRILAQGKEVVRIKLNGRTFFEEGKDLALNSLSSDILCEIRLYKEYSDEEANTGVYRSEGEPVLDVYTYEDRSRGWLLDLAGAGGSKKRYQANGSISGFSSRMQGILSASADNQPPIFGLGESYLDKLSTEINENDVVRQNYSGILNVFNGPWEINATAFWNKGKTEASSDETTEYYGKDSQVYAQARGDKSTDTETANFSLDWTYTGKGLTWKTKTFLNRSDYNHMLYSLSETRERYEETINGESMNSERALNSNQYTNNGLLKNFGGGVSTALNKSWGDLGSNWDLSASFQYTRNKEDGFSHADIYFSDLAEMSRQVLETHSSKKNFGGFVKGVLTWVPYECAKFQLAYMADGRYDYIDKKVYDLSYVFLDLINEGRLPADSMSNNAHLITWTHDIRALAQFEAGGWVLTGGVTLEPQRMLLHYYKSSIGVDSAQTSYSILPELTVTYQKKESWGISLSYLGRSKQPDLAGLLPIWDCTDPLHRFVGNASLRPETSHLLSASFYSFKQETQRQINVATNVVFNRHAITQKTDYDAQKGVYRIMPVNVDGNWNASCFFDFTTSFRNARQWNLEWKSAINTAAEHALQEWSDVKQKEASVKVISLTTTHYGAVQYRYRALSFKPYAFLTLANYQNNLQKELNSSLWIYGGGGEVRLDLDFGMSMGVDFYRNCRSGYWDETMNGKEWICNLEVSYSFLKNKAMEIKLQGFDVLHELHSVNQINTVAFRRETVNHKGVNSYFMLSLRYHFDRFPKGDNLY